MPCLVGAAGVPETGCYEMKKPLTICSTWHRGSNAVMRLTLIRGSGGARSTDGED